MADSKGARITVRKIATGEKRQLTQKELQDLLKREQAKDSTVRMKAHAGKKYIASSTTDLYEF